jgi:hypothetical protein
VTWRAWREVCAAGPQIGKVEGAAAGWGPGRRAWALRGLELWTEPHLVRWPGMETRSKGPGYRAATATAMCDAICLVLVFSIALYVTPCDDLTSH